MPKHAVSECSTVCLPVIFELLPGLIPFASKWHAGLILYKNVYINMSNNYLTTMYEGHPINSGNVFIIRTLIRLAYQNYIVNMAKHVAHIIHYPKFISSQ